MLISVIVPLYRGEKYISRIIDSIESNINIDCSNIEIIFVNDYPQEFFKVTDYTSRVRIEFLNHKQNKGIHQTKIDGFMKSKGQYILFLDQDDSIARDYFDSQLQKIRNFDAVFCNGYRRQKESIYSSEKMKSISFDLNEYLSSGYPLISLGQMLIRKEAVPRGWLNHPMKNNGWDDHLFWVCMMHEKSAVVYNDKYLYVHEEDGNNASFNWMAMTNSGIEFKDKVVGLEIFDEVNKREFINTIEKRVAKYEKYMALDELINHTKAQWINDYLCRNLIQSIAIYGIGLYGRKLCQLIDSQRICIKYGIDKNASNKNAEFPIYEEIKEDVSVDCIVCATGFEDEEIKTRIPGKGLTFKEILEKSNMTKGQNSSGRVLIWGIGTKFEIVKNSINYQNCTVVGLVDTIKQGIRDNYEIISPGEIKEKDYDLIVISPLCYESIVENCKSLEIPTEKLYIFWDETQKKNPFIDEAKRQKAFLEARRAMYEQKRSNMPFEHGKGIFPKIHSAEAALHEIIIENKSLCRFGDGEFEIIRGKDRPWFQKADKRLADRLLEVLRSDEPQILIAIADNFGNLDKYTQDAADAIRAYMTAGTTRDDIIGMLDIKKDYFDAYVSRPYMMYQDKTQARVTFGLMKQLWKKRNLFIVEGEHSYMGVNNDLFEAAGNVRRMECPAKNAFQKYDDILEQACALVRPDELVLITLGPTATVLAYDMAKRGIQAIDIGQVDNEYDWYKKGSIEKEEISGKCVAELSHWHEPPMRFLDERHQNEIIARIL